MEFLDGYEYSVDCVGDGRRLVAAVQRRKAKAGGYGQEIVDIPELTRAIGEMTEVFGLSGLFNAQFREGRNGFRLLEINPRFSGGIGYAGAIGVNLPYLALHGLTHGFPDQAHRVASGARVLELAHFRRIEDPF
jgi:predicted ATP-grasp superfamily ATP-dependent carboligase